AIGAKKTFVMMDFLTKTGESKLVETCTYPLTGIACVSRIYTDMAVIDLTQEGAKVVDLVEGLSFEKLQSLTKVKLSDAR
ncbi:MAG: CoA-transferase, partial [Paralcaligenes sp.]